MSFIFGYAVLTTLNYELYGSHFYHNKEKIEASGAKKHWWKIW